MKTTGLGSYMEGLNATCKTTSCQNTKILFVCAENNCIPDVLYTFCTLYLLLCIANSCLTTCFVDKYIVNLGSLSPIMYHRWSKWGCNSPGFFKMHCLSSDAVATSLPLYQNCLTQCGILNANPCQTKLTALLKISLWIVNHQNRGYNVLQIFTGLQVLSCLNNLVDL